MLMRFFALAVTGLLLSVAGYADPVYSPAIYQVSASVGDSGTSQNGFTTVSVSIGSLLPIPGHPGTGLAQAIAGPNLLGVYGYASAVSTTFSVGATASITDALYLSNAPTSGILALYVNVNGSSVVLSRNQGIGVADVMLSANGSCIYLSSNYQPPNCGLLGEGINVLNVPYVENSNSIVGLGMYFEADDTCLASETIPISSCFAQSSFLDTAQVASIVVEDSNGNPVPGAAATSLSGVNYSLPSSTVPEPSSLILLCTGLVGVVGTLRRRPHR